MAYSKKDEFSAPEAALAAYHAALSHPARIAILKVLATREECVCGEIVDLLPLAQSTVSQHLKVLKEAGLIQGTLDGPRTCYCIDPKAVKRLSGLLEGFLIELKSVKKGRKNEKPVC
jgi:ArsR family transcriptional regulator